MAKQTFTTGQVLTAAQMTSLQQTAMLGGDATAKTTSYVLVAADAGTVVAMNSGSSTTITVNTSLFSAGDIVTIQNRGAGTCTVTAGTATVNTSGSLVLAQYQGGVLYFNSTSAAVFYQFATPASGDIEGVTAGTGISGGGTSGTVTITNSMATAIDAKGDLVVGTGADAFSRLAVGTTEHRLVAASGETTGLKYVADTTNYAIAAKGDLLVGSAADTLSALSVGTNGHTLVADSSESLGVKWAAPAGGGKVLQVVSTTYSTSTSVSSDTTWTDSGVTLNITPSSASSKVLILASYFYRKNGGDGDAAVDIRLVRGSTAIYTVVRNIQTDAIQFHMQQNHMSYLDSPSTTSATTYKIQFKGNTATTVFMQYLSNPSSFILMEIGA